MPDGSTQMLKMDLMKNVVRREREREKRHVWLSSSIRCLSSPPSPTWYKDTYIALIWNKARKAIRMASRKFKIPF